MPFNADTYRANRDEKEARRWMQDARRWKIEGRLDDARRAVALARLAWRSARLWREIRDGAR